MEDKKELRRSRIRALIIAGSFVIAILSFVYGLVNNIVAEKQKEIAEQTTVRLMECEQKAEELTKHKAVLNARLMQALNAAREAKDLAEKNK
jgi:F0F1-type ATP synthase membrane subunit b/b'